MKGKRDTPMEPALRQGAHIYIPFRDGGAVLDVSCKPRMFKSAKRFGQCYPDQPDGVTIVEYAPVREVPANER